MLDYLIVGFGIAGASLSFRLEESGLDFLVFEDNSQQSSKIAGGIMNPVVLKRFTLAWKANEQLDIATEFYQDLERHLQAEFFQPLEIYRKFFSVEEQNNWFEAADKAHLSPFLDTPLQNQLNPAIPADFSFGRVLRAARIETGKMLGAYSDSLLRKGKLQQTRFAYEDLKLGENGVEYQGRKARNIIFCDGFGLLKNPFFNYLPFYGNKGEYIIIKSASLKLQVAVKSSIFILPLGNDFYKVGATYNNLDKSSKTTSEARNELLEKLNKTITAPYEIVNQVAGIRPSMRDRRPIVGQHPKHKNVFCCNGFGSRGVLIAPWVSGKLLELIENAVPLSEELDVSRFTKKYFRD